MQRTNKNKNHLVKFEGARTEDQQKIESNPIFNMLTKAGITIDEIWKIDEGKFNLLKKNSTKLDSQLPFRDKELDEKVDRTIRDIVENEYSALKPEVRKELLEGLLHRSSYIVDNIISDEEDFSGDESPSGGIKISSSSRKTIDDKIKVSSNGETKLAELLSKTPKRDTIFSDLKKNNLKKLKMFIYSTFKQNIVDKTEKEGKKIENIFKSDSKIILEQEAYQLKKKKEKRNSLLRLLTIEKESSSSNDTGSYFSPNSDRSENSSDSMDEDGEINKEKKKFLHDLIGNIEIDTNIGEQDLTSEGDSYRNSQNSIKNIKKSSSRFSDRPGMSATDVRSDRRLRVYGEVEDFDEKIIFENEEDGIEENVREKACLEDLSTKRIFEIISKEIIQKQKESQSKEEENLSKIKRILSHRIGPLIVPKGSMVLPTPQRPFFAPNELMQADKRKEPVQEPGLAEAKPLNAVRKVAMVVSPTFKVKRMRKDVKGTVSPNRTEKAVSKLDAIKLLRRNSRLFEEPSFGEIYSADKANMNSKERSIELSPYSNKKSKKNYEELIYLRKLTKLLAEKHLGPGPEKSFSPEPIIRKPNLNFNDALLNLRVLKRKKENDFSTGIPNKKAKEVIRIESLPILPHIRRGGVLDENFEPRKKSNSPGEKELIDAESLPRLETTVRRISIKKDHWRGLPDYERIGKYMEINKRSTDTTQIHEKSEEFSKFREALPGIGGDKTLNNVFEVDVGVF